MDERERFYFQKAMTQSGNTERCCNNTVRMYDEEEKLVLTLNVSRWHPGMQPVKVVHEKRGLLFEKTFVCE